MKGVQLGYARCNFGDEFLQSMFNSWDDGESCLPFCRNVMDLNNWKKGCCEAQRLFNGQKTLCKIHDKADVVRPGDSNSKAVQCTGILTAFNIGH